MDRVEHRARGAIGVIMKPFDPVGKEYVSSVAANGRGVARAQIEVGEKRERSRGLLPVGQSTRIR